MMKRWASLRTEAERLIFDISIFDLWKQFLHITRLNRYWKK